MNSCNASLLQWRTLAAVLMAGLIWPGCAHRPPSSHRSADPAILQVLSRQAEAWNRGDIEAFMEGYIPSQRLRFAGAGGVQRGWEETLARYRAAYPSRAAMGKLSFENLEITPLSPQHAEVFGQYRLHRGGAYEDATGFFTLLVEQTPAGWRIVHDHSSAAQMP